MGILEKPIFNTPVAIIDFETTGLTPGYDRVIEVSVVRINPGEAPKLVFDTLVNPQRPVSATEIHGITDADVADAPTFPEIAADLVARLSGCVIAAYNVYFDIKFLDFELSNSGHSYQLPHFCVMYLRPMLGLGKRCKLNDACELEGISFEGEHIASQDALATGDLLVKYLDVVKNRNIQTFSDLAKLKKYKFNSSFSHDPLPELDRLDAGENNLFKSRARGGVVPAIDPVRVAYGEYWDALKDVVYDLEVAEEELSYIKKIRRSSILSKEQIRMLHAKVFMSAISQFSADKEISDREVLKLRKLSECLQTLGWAPGQ